MEVLNIIDKNYLFEMLVIGKRTHSLINTHGLRNIGKTSMLIKYAKNYNYGVVVRTEFEASDLRKQYSFEQIYNQDDKQLSNLKNVVIDEHVDIDNLLKKYDINIITGFINKEKQEEDTNIIDNKKEETYFIGYVAYSKLDGHFDMFNTIITINEPINTKIVESIESDLLKQIKDNRHEDSAYYAVQLVSINKINN